MTIVGLALWLILIMVTAFKWVEARTTYINLYRERIDPGIPTNEERAARYASDPVRYFAELPGTVRSQRKLGNLPHDDPDLERARRVQKRRQIYLLIALFVGALIPVLSAMLEH